MTGLNVRSEPQATSRDGTNDEAEAKKQILDRAIEEHGVPLVAAAIAETVWPEWEVPSAAKGIEACFLAIRGMLGETGIEKLSKGLYEFVQANAEGCPLGELLAVVSDLPADGTGLPDEADPADAHGTQPAGTDGTPRQTTLEERIDGSGNGSSPVSAKEARLTDDQVDRILRELGLVPDPDSDSDTAYR